MSYNTLEKSILNNSGIFLLYLSFCSLFLFNRSGGSDILFFFLMLLCLVIHVIYAIFKDLKTKTAYRSSVVILLSILFIVLSSSYLKLLRYFI